MKPARTFPAVHFSAPRLLDLGAVALLGVVATLTFGPVFGGWQGYLAAGAGTLLGLGVALLSGWRRWGLATTAAVVLIVYLLFVGPVALRDSTIAGFIPTLDTLARGSLLIVQGWRDLLTVATPASSFSGPAVVPFITGLVCTTAAGRMIQWQRRPQLALLPMLAFLLVGILWGTTRAPAGLAIGLAFAVVCLCWAALRAATARAELQNELGLQVSNPRLAPRRLLAAVGVLAVACGAATAAAPALAGTQNRFVLRNVVEPPLDLRKYASPLMSYRYLELDQKTTTQFSVDSLPAGSGVRLATLDAYDGMVYNVADSSAGFARAGEDIQPRTEVVSSGGRTTLNVTIDDYAGVWLPGGGDLRGIAFEGPNATSQARSLYHNSDTGTALVTAGLAKGDSYAVDLVVPPQVGDDELQELGVSGVTQPTNQGVPDAVSKVVPQLVGEASTPVEQVLAIEKGLHEQGFYSNGSDGKSLSGHSEARITAMLSSAQWVGDDEQYAVAMALMVRQLGIPARVVMGFYPAEDAAAGPWSATGDDAHVWVEVPFEKVGWVAFDPTPDRDRVPETTVPRPQPRPRPQVQPPPVPPKEPPQPPVEMVEKKDADDKGMFDLAFLRWIGLGLGWTGLISSPVWVLALLRGRRRRQRLAAEATADQLAGGWAEVLDAATDLGVGVDRQHTRQENAAKLAELTSDIQPHALAARVDAGVFGAGDASGQEVSKVWDESSAMVLAMRRSVPRWRQLAYWVTPRSLRHPAPSGLAPARLVRRAIRWPTRRTS